MGGEIARRWREDREKISEERKNDVGLKSSRTLLNHTHTHILAPLSLAGLVSQILTLTMTITNNPLTLTLT